MLDPITAIATATTAFRTIQSMVNAGRELEDVAGQLGKWYTAVSDLGHAEQEAKNPPLFKKLFAGGSVEEEALSILMNKKKLAEQENQLKVMLNFRYGHNTWEEMIQLRRKIRKQRQETVYKQKERRRALLEGLFALVAIIVFIAIAGGSIYGIGVWNGNW